MKKNQPLFHTKSILIYIDMTFICDLKKIDLFVFLKTDIISPYLTCTYKNKPDPKEIALTSFSNSPEKTAMISIEMF